MPTPVTDAYWNTIVTANQAELQQQQLEEAARKRRALALALSGIGQPQAAQFGGPRAVAPVAGAGPAVGPGGAAPPSPLNGLGARPQGMAPSLPVGPGGQSVPYSVGAPAASPPAAAGGPPPSAGGGGAGPPAGTGAPPAGAPQLPPGLMAQLAVMRGRIMQANPNADPADVMEALRLSADLLSKDNSTETRLMVAQLQQQGALDRTLANIQERLYQVDTMSADRQRGQNITLQLGEQRNDIAQERVNQAKTQAQGGTLDPTTVAFLGQSLRAGNLQQVNEVLGYSRNRAALMGQIIAEAKRQDPNFDGQSAAAALAQFGGVKAGATTVARRGAQLSQAGGAFVKAADLVVQNAKKLDMGNVVLLNNGEISLKQQTSDPATAAYVASLNSAINLYARAISPTGQGRIADKEHAREILLKGYSPEAMKAAMETLKQEVGFEKQSTQETQQEIPGQIPGGAGGAPAGNVIRYDAQGNRVQ